MIGSLKGKIIHKEDRYVLLETLGVGYKVWVSPEVLTKAPLGEEAFLWIHTNVREDALELYGFLSKEELEFFQMLLSVSGIGPKSALTILGIASIETLK